jgi:hypothetical protein
MQTLSASKFGPRSRKVAFGFDLRSTKYNNNNDLQNLSGNTNNKTTNNDQQTIITNNKQTLKRYPCPRHVHYTRIQHVDTIRISSL